MPMDVTLLEFGDGHATPVARPCQFADVASAVAGLGLRGGQPVLVVIGGAAGLDEVDRRRLLTLFGHALLPVVASRQAVVVDGGTDSGVMRLLGRARAEAGASFPLVGVAAKQTVILPGDGAEPGDRAPLERNHSHFVLVPGSSWGDESPWLSWVATEIAGSAPSATVLINGGELAFQDVARSLEADRPVLVIAGTGRAADRIAAAVHGHHADEQAARLAGSPMVTAVPLAEDPAAVRAALAELTEPEALRSRPLQVVLHGFLERPHPDPLVGQTGPATVEGPDLRARSLVAGTSAQA
jgi:TRPM family ion channel